MNLQSASLFLHHLVQLNRRQELRADSISASSLIAYWNFKGWLMNKPSVSGVDCLIMNQDTMYSPNCQNYTYTHTRALQWKQSQVNLTTSLRTTRIVFTKIRQRLIRNDACHTYLLINTLILVDIFRGFSKNKTLLKLLGSWNKPKRSFVWLQQYSIHPQNCEKK